MAKVRVLDSLGGLQDVRVLLNSRSRDRDYFRMRFSTRVRTVEKSNVSYGTFTTANTKVKKLLSVNSFLFIRKSCSFVHLILTHIITSLLNDKLPPAVRECYRHLLLADMEFDVLGPIDMLKGVICTHICYSPR